MLDVEEDARDEDHRYEDALTIAGADSKFGIACESADAEQRKAATPTTANTISVRPLRRPAEPEEDATGDDHDPDLDRRVGDGVQREPAEVDAARQRRARGSA